ncbi:hypothetical protein CJ030_MR5G004851 [Morella rubra]|uniref:RNase H type-1 domain-containing protein n=1 Tax=Morella rubra TaxID=262757 RepID=A0A6A1VPZ3_9ROSI|nr:hypothetical protein CJ030_MR5G004851 [Morella rubra]
MAACVCCDFLGTVIHTETKKLATVDPLVGEAEAMLSGVQVACLAVWSDVLFEGDSSVVVDAVGRDLADCPWVIETIISKIKDLFVESPRFRCSFSPRSANVAAHSLAQWAASSGREGCFPEFCGLFQRLPWVFEGSAPP